MNKDRENYIKELEAKIQILEVENNFFALKAQENQLLTTAFEKIHLYSNTSEMYDEILENISVLLNIDFSALFSYEKNNLYSVANFCQFNDLDNVKCSLEIDKESLLKLSQHQSVFLPVSKYKFYYYENKFEPIALSLIPIPFNKQNLLFVLGVNKDAEFLNSSTGVLNKIASIVALKLERQFFENKLEKINTELEKKVKERTQRLKESEAKYKAAFLTSPDSVTINSLDGTYIDINEGFTELTGFTKEDTIGKTSAEIKIWANINDRKRLVDELLQTEIIRNFEAEFIKKNGENLTGIMSAKLIQLEGKPHILSITKDISDRKNMETKLKNQQKLFETMFNTITDAIVITDIDRKIVLANNGIKTTFGYEPKDIIGKTTQILYPDAEKYKDLGKKIYDKNAKSTDNIYYSNYKKKDKTIFPAETFGTKLYDEKGDWIGNLGIMRDISERQKLIAQLVEEKIKAQENEQKFEELFRLSPSALVISKIDSGEIIDVNDSFTKLFKFEKSELIGKTSNELNLIVDNEIRVIGIKKLRIKRKAKGIEVQFKPKTGNIIHGLVSVSIVNIYGAEYLLSEITDISFKKETENTLLKLSAAVQQSANAIVITDKNGFIEYINPQFTKQTGYSLKEIKGKTPRILKSGKHSDLFYHDMWEALNKGETWKTEFVNKRKNGILYWEQNTISPIKNKKGEITNFIAIKLDISEKKENERALLESEKNFRLLFENSPLGTYIATPRGEIINVNNTVLKMLNSPSKEATMQINVLKFPPLVENGYSQKFQNTVETGKSQKITTNYTSKWGKTLIFSSYIIPLKNENGKVELVYTIMQDISEETLAKKELIIAKENAEESEKIYRDLFNNATDAIYVQDKDGRFLDVNEGAIKMYGYKKEYFIGKTPEFLAAPGKNDMQKIKEYIDDAINGIPHQTEFWGKRKNGQIFPKYIRFQQGSFQGEKAVITYSLDITKQKETEQKLIEAKEKAEESNMLKTEFLQNMSHEIRTPLNGILGFTQFLKNPKLPKEKILRFVNIIENSGNQLLKIIDDIIEISKLETKQVEAFEEEISLNSLLFELFSVFEIRAQKSQLSLYLKKGLLDNESYIYTDETKLRKILGNLLENAFKFTNTGYIEFGYKLIESESPKIQLYVKDTGVGILPEKQKLIFERFSQEEKEMSQKVGGLGLGLSIAKENTELLGGQISLKSEKGKGATFFVEIPYKKVENQKQKTKTKNILLHKKQTILIVEDEEVNYLYIETLLLEQFKLNATIIHAKNGKEALEFYKQNKTIDLILMDIKMPIMNGLEATINIRKLNPNIPIIAQTAYSTNQDKAKALKAGCNDYISKPIEEEKLKTLISYYLQKN